MDPNTLELLMFLSYNKKDLVLKLSGRNILSMAYWGALIVSPPVWGAIADGIHNQKLAHTMCLVSAAFLFFSIQYVTSFPLMCVMVFIANFQTQPSFSLLDHASMAWLERVAGDYGKQRLYGAAGYGAGGYFASVVASSLGI
ncbi:hypothetical protein PInf_013203 [Phytophthora infestans]|nr:hypothetical protein PInf_013203 [Phytophthora infestans]